jgi:Protein of unknown function (DUF2505)
MEYSSTFLAVAPDIVRAEFISNEFLLAFGEEVGVASGAMSQQTTSDGLDAADLPWTFPTDRPGIPSLARRLLPSEVRLDWHQEWGPAGARPIPGSMTVELHGSPSATVNATAKLIAKGQDTHYQVFTKIRTSLRWPVAGTVESTIDKELVGWILEVQSRVLRRRLELPTGG